MTEDGLDTLLRDAGVEGRFAGPAEIDRVVALAVEESLRDELVSAVLETCDAHWADGERYEPAGLEMRIGTWRLDLGRGAVRTGLMTSIVAGALVQQGLTQMVIGVVAAVVPSVLDIQRVELTAADRRLAIELRLHPDVAAGGLTEDELYDRLPAPTRDVVNRFEFADFVQRLRAAGYAGAGPTPTVADPDGPPTRFSWR